jgi:hypothetical protein
VIGYGLAMAYLEAAVVVYLRRALGSASGAPFPLHEGGAWGDLGAIEVGREVATLLMLLAVGWLAGSTWFERLAWTAVAFGAWDIGYYAWLWVLAGWPPSPATWDILFLVPVPWVAPVLAPVTVSCALVGFGLAVARHLRCGRPVAVGRWQVAGGLAGGALVILSFTLDAGWILAGGVPRTFPWPVFVVGMAVAVAAAVTALSRDRARTGQNGATPTLSS